MGNYFLDKTNKVSGLVHFPYDSFSDFQQAIKSGEIIDIGIPMDRARSWAMEGKSAPKLQQILKIILAITLFVLPVFYIVSAFVMHNYWLLPFALIPLIVSFTGSPMARRMFPFHWLLLIGLGIMWLISGDFPHAIYWLPIFLQYKSLDYLYKNSAQLVRQRIQEDEELLCLFWKHWGITIFMKNGDEYDQRSKKIAGLFSHYEDVQKEWEKALEERKNK